MGREQLFLNTFDELEALSRQGSQSEYDILKIPLLLRKLLMDDLPLVEAINREYKLKIKYRINDSGPSTTQGLIYWSVLDSFDPDTSPPEMINPVEVRVERLLQTEVMIYKGQRITVKDIVRYLAYVEGGIHIGEPASDKDKALTELKERVQLGGYQPAIIAMRAIGRVVAKGLKPLRQELGRPRKQNYHPAPKSGGRSPRGQRHST